MILCNRILRSSFSHTILLIVGLTLITLAITYWVVLNYAILPSLEPFSRILGHEIRMLTTDELLLDDGSLVKFPTAWRKEIFHQLGISLFSADTAMENGLRWARSYQLLTEEMSAQLGVAADVRLEITKNHPVIWLNTEYSPDIWIRVPLIEVHQGGIFAILRYTVFIILLAIIIAWLFFRFQNKPLMELEGAAKILGKGDIPLPVKEQGAADVRSVVRAFNHMVSDIKKLEDDRRLIIAGVSHDLRTPLARLRLISEMLPEEEMSVQESINLEVEECNKILQQFLDFMHTGEEIKKQPIEINTLLIDVISHFSEHLEGLEYELYDGPLDVMADPISMKRVINNLIVNAQNYGNGWIKVVSGRAAKQVWIQIDDDGPGINPEDLDRIFEPFVRGEAARTTSGSGLGLSIVKRIIESHKGSIFVSRGVRNGFSIRIYLPLSITSSK
ncbi:two-component system sensor histidine kinase EnvZ [Thorsellia anophelis]|uniref:Sensor histidine kinase EnvZ n=1 Tax=Thorsellia anophelis DSM 18579 TaxID=1123402 RepID=A0A1H9Y6U7_9GAMM|nr:two-component system sensor histidine kinase EnvZ [Thorsellia anophelis]SES64119.1 two-component system, OmpR family, osmolarity sensor histidine kinase EnvZ [Thorsellia anophelis DSM 18579]